MSSFPEALQSPRLSERASITDMEPHSEAPQIHRVLLRSQVSLSVPGTLSDTAANMRRAEILRSRDSPIPKTRETPIRKTSEAIPTSEGMGTLSGSRKALTSRSSTSDELAISSSSNPYGSKEEKYSVGRRITRTMHGMETLPPPRRITLSSFERGKSRISNKHKNANAKPNEEMHSPIDAAEPPSGEEESIAKKPRLIERAILTPQDSLLRNKTHSVALMNGVLNHRITRLNSLKIKLLEETKKHASDLIQMELSESKHVINSLGITVVKQVQEKISPRPARVLTRGKANAKECLIQEEKPPLIEAKANEIKKCSECDGLESEHHHLELEGSPRWSIESLKEEINVQVNAKSILAKEKLRQKEEKFLHHAENILPSGIRKRGRPPGTKNKLWIKESTVNKPRRRGRPCGEGHSHRMRHADQHHGSISAEVNTAKRVTVRGELSRVIGRRRKMLKGLQDSMIGEKLNVVAGKNGINESSEVELLEMAAIARRKISRPFRGRRGGRKGSSVMRGNTESQDVSIREVRLMRSGLPTKRGGPTGGGKWKGSLTSSLSLKGRKRMRMMHELEEPMEKLDNEDNPVAKRQKKMKESVLMARKLRRNLTKKKLDDGHESKCSKNKCSQEHLFVKATETKTEKGKSTVGHKACNDVIRYGENDIQTVHMFPASKVAEGTTDMQKGIVNTDFPSKYCLVSPSPMDTGGRQMRPRPLDLMQPLLTLVEGQDQEYYDFDGGSFHRLFQQQSEPVNCCIEKLKGHESSSESVPNTGTKDKPIFLPAFRSRGEPEDKLQISYAVPDSYIKAKPQIRAHQAEYDMDEEDEEWLKKYNGSLSPSSVVSADQFERMIDLLENGAAKSYGYDSLVQSIEEQSRNLEECCICNGGENAEDNPVFKCAACRILVHQSCYGIQDSITDGTRGSWHCRKCQAVFEGREDADISCALCQKQGGALKPSTEPHIWAHVVCALYTNETYFVNPDAMEPIDGLSAANARVKRQRRQCWLCGIKEGSVEKCSVPSCKAYFHVSCGVAEGASFELQHSNDQVISVREYCPTHAAIASNLGARDGENDELTSIEESSLHTNGSHNISTARRMGRKRKNRIHKKKASGQGEGEPMVANLGKATNGVQEKCTDSNRDERLEHIGHVENVMGDDLIREGNISHGVHHNACTVPELMDGIYLYWISKREKYGGSLLHHIQQEHAAKKFGIFNSEDVEHIVSVNSGKCDIEKTVVDSRSEPEIFQKITELVAERERLELNIQSLNQDILKVTVEFLKARGSSGICSQCNETGLSLECTACLRKICFNCSMLKSGFKCDSNWLFSLKKFECFHCLQQCQRRPPLSCEAPFLSDMDDDRPSSSMSSEFVRTVENRMFGVHPSLAKPCMVLPWLDFMHQHRLTNEVPWKRSPPKKTISIANLLSVPKPCFIDVP